MDKLIYVSYVVGGCRIDLPVSMHEMAGQAHVLAGSVNDVFFDGVVCTGWGYFPVTSAGFIKP